MRIVIAGGAGFVGSHWVARCLARGDEVVVVDNLLTGRMANLERLRAARGARSLEFLLADACHLPAIDGPVDAVLHLASPASPIAYLRQPLQTLDAGPVA